MLIVAIIGVPSIFFIKNKPSIIPSVTVEDQKIKAGEVEIGEVIALKPSWLVIQTNEGGIPGPVLGYKKIETGSNKNLKVKIDSTKITPSLHAMIHEDTGIKDRFDFPNNDVPLMYKMEMVTKIFNILE